MNSLSLQESYKVVNRMVSAKLSHSLDLEKIHSMLPNSEYFKGRPTMIKMKLPDVRYTILIFPNGRIQLLGKTVSDDYEYVRTYLQDRLRLDIPPFTVDAMTVVYKFSRPCHLKSITHSSSERFYEPELFPALLLTTWKPTHVALFASGTVVLTGVKCFNAMHEIVNEIKHIYL